MMRGMAWRGNRAQKQASKHGRGGGAIKLMAVRETRCDISVGVGLGVGDRVAPPLGECEGVPEPVRAAQALSEREGEGVTENDAEPVLEGVPVGGWEAKADAETLLAEDAAAVVEPVGEGTALPPVAEVVLVVVGESKALPPVAEAVRVAVGEVEPVMEAEPDA